MVSEVLEAPRPGKHGQHTMVSEACDFLQYIFAKERNSLWTICFPSPQMLEAPRPGKHGQRIKFPSSQTFEVLPLLQVDKSPEATATEDRSRIREFITPLVERLGTAADALTNGGPLTHNASFWTVFS